MSVVWSRQRVVQRTFGTIVSIAGLALQVKSEGALCECHELKANFDANLSESCGFVYSRLMMCPVSSSIVIRATTFSHKGPEDDVVR